MEYFKDYVKMSKEEHLNNLRHASDLAELVGSQRMMTHYAKQYLDMVSTMVTSGDDDLKLAYQEQMQHLRSAQQLLVKAINIK